MAKIKSIKSGKNRKRANLSTDDDNLLSLDKEVILDERLNPGEEIDEKRIDKLKQADILHRCVEAGKHFIGFRPRSESEVKARLHKQGYDESSIDKAIEKLKELDLINDLSFAIFWCNSRLFSNPKSKNLVKYELRRKGIPRDIADKAICNLDDESNALKAALKKLRSLHTDEYSEFHDKLLNYLKWRGFTYEIIENVCKNLWQKMHG